MAAAVAHAWSYDQRCAMLPCVDTSTDLGSYTTQTCPALPELALRVCRQHTDMVYTEQHPHNAALSTRAHNKSHVRTPHTTGDADQSSTRHSQQTTSSLQRFNRPSQHTQAAQQQHHTAPRQAGQSRLARQVCCCLSCQPQAAGLRYYLSPSRTQSSES